MLGQAYVCHPGNPSLVRPIFPGSFWFGTRVFLRRRLSSLDAWMLLFAQVSSQWLDSLATLEQYCPGRQSVRWRPVVVSPLRRRSINTTESSPSAVLFVGTLDRGHGTRFQDGRVCRGPKISHGTFSRGNPARPSQRPSPAIVHGPAHFSCSHYCSCGAQGHEEEGDISGRPRTVCAHSPSSCGPQDSFICIILSDPAKLQALWGRRRESHGVPSQLTRRTPARVVGVPQERPMVPNLI